VAYAGSDILFECLFEDEVEWRKRSGGIHSRHRISSHLLFLNGVEEQDSGLYSCFSLNREGILFEAQSILKVGGKILV